MNVKWERPAQRMAERENSVHVRATLQTPRLNRDVRAVMLLEPYDLYDELSSRRMIIWFQINLSDKYILQVWRHTLVILDFGDMGTGRSVTKKRCSLGVVLPVRVCGCNLIIISIRDD